MPDLQKADTPFECSGLVSLVWGVQYSPNMDGRLQGCERVLRLTRQTDILLFLQLQTLAP